MSRKLGLAVVQMGPINLADSRESVVKRLLALLREAHARGAKLAVFPELALTTFFPRWWMSEEEAVAKFFERAMPNPVVQPLFDEARKREVGFYLGYAELENPPAANAAAPLDRGAEPRRYNTSILVDQGGNIVGRYRKIHLPGHAEHKPEAPFQHLEKKFFHVGNEGFKVWQTMGANVGMCICNDRRWPEAFRVMGLQTVEIVCLGYNTPSHNIHWPEPPHLRMFHHLLSLQANAYQNATWIAAAAKCGFEDGFHMIGGSAIVSPSGEIAAQAATEDDEVIFANVDLALGENFRRHVFNFAKHRRPEHYGLIVERVGAGDPLG